MGKVKKDFFYLYLRVHLFKFTQQGSGSWEAEGVASVRKAHMLQGR